MFAALVHHLVYEGREIRGVEGHSLARRVAATPRADVDRDLWGCLNQVRAKYGVRH